MCIRDSLYPPFCTICLAGFSGAKEPEVLAASRAFAADVQLSLIHISDTAKLAARYAADVCSAAAAVEAGLADMAVPAAGVRAAVVSCLLYTSSAPSAPATRV